MLAVKMFLGFMLLGAALSVWMFFGEMISLRSSVPIEAVMEDGDVRSVTKVDLYLVEFEGVSSPVLGDAESVSSDLPAPVDRSLVGSSLPGMRILGVIPAGSSVMVTGATRTVNAPLELRGRVDGHDGEVDLSFVQDYASDSPSLSARLFSPAPAPAADK